ncbi:DUF1232 domain-containing protein [Paraliomyxa miuraensis]|uniref:DUF1232 domain-containing protein n=1 Tax=Paraliomyxa miuraensis TaxID=376150 RepID=UPI00225AB816|nr:YkvA family protein [Paraliomyxa miuraensis]MCX4241461.1 DUF1232 domain-containing protein [Paraliomyxa miuraensis]
MAAPLLDMLSRVCERIGELREDEDVERFASVLLARRPEAFEGLPGGATGSAARAMAPRIARKQLELVRELPGMVETIAATLDVPTDPPALQLMQVAALAYLVDPGDLLPDDMPAGYGFVDDSIVLRAMAVTVPPLYGMDATAVARERLVIDFHGLCIPRAIAPELERSVRSSSTMVQMLGLLPPALVHDSIRRLLEEPLVPLQSQPPAGTGWGLSQGSWFRLPDGVLEELPGGGVRYRLDHEMGVALLGDALERR